MKNRYLIYTAQAISLVFSPFYLPVVAFVILYFFSYLSYMPWQYSLWVISMVYIFTILLPRLGIFVYRKLNGWTRHQLSHRERRIVPYLLSIVCYATLLILMDYLCMPRFTLSVVVGALGIQIACALINVRLKVSTHAAAAGGFVGALIAFSILLHFDPTPWLCLTILLSGLVCTARLILRQHTLPELGVGVLVGILSGFMAIWFV